MVKPYALHVFSFGCGFTLLTWQGHSMWASVSSSSAQSANLIEIIPLEKDKCYLSCCRELDILCIALAQEKHKLGKPFKRHHGIWQHLY